MFKRTQLIKRELFYWRKALFEYKKIWAYIYYKYIFSKKILDKNEILERPVNNSDLSVHILTCHFDFKMFFWSLASYYNAFKIYGQLYIHNDGTLSPKEINLIKKFFPSARIIDARTFANDFENKLNQYPVFKSIRARHFNFFSFKKIIDTFLAADNKMCLIFDTDILWFKNPIDIEEQIKLGCPRSLMQKNNTYKFLKDGAEIDQQLTQFNAGIILYARENFDTNILIDFFQQLNENNKKELHFADQTGHVKCLKNLSALPEDKYIIRGSVNENTIAKHYTAPRRPLFYLEGILVVMSSRAISEGSQ
ncbi:hypothetical protein COX27_01770 [Candidatus Kuenenbacteria bacterium CG23_combo_of_CG06-09_8_20_14_all_36_9]|uniref:Nucleotide-diphospho-sugar transferase domain-containing protein n=1 Tax=Candidatus Kuenenbacteria bacterium CG10_big_fil_rev_8_21_14_0_10_36_11 TaxID=1974618 RepID=A0A2M6W9U9_9BACT|nr:MAG: hypothetical protein COX27_01770 [Candidatus Kuenenbacteria bacterium CG23_combo_of_CG06-09_8_20_14_all_36_9]PIT89573.1 MAG: hypothetical protein COU23_03130 [Candidatus Kuenenbacteria bacterium CG10_big_fil_rev_8_21_14_0_10_36_11]